jgi:hypothetical protein
MVLLRLALGVTGAQLTGRMKFGEPTLVEALDLVFVCGTVALYLDVSYLIAVMVMGVVIANTAKHHEYPFHKIEDIKWPFILIFCIGGRLTCGYSLATNYLHRGDLYCVSNPG